MEGKLYASASLGSIAVKLGWVICLQWNWKSMSVLLYGKEKEKHALPAKYTSIAVEHTSCIAGNKCRAIYISIKGVLTYGAPLHFFFDDRPQTFRKDGDCSKKKIRLIRFFFRFPVFELRLFPVFAVRTCILSTPVFIHVFGPLEVSFSMASYSHALSSTEKRFSELLPWVVQVWRRSIFENCSWFPLGLVFHLHSRKTQRAKYLKSQKCGFAVCCGPFWANVCMRQGILSPLRVCWEYFFPIFGFQNLSLDPQRVFLHSRKT